MKPLWELQHSKNLIDRMNFVKRVKILFLPQIQKRIEILEKEDGADYELALEKRFLIGVKKLLSNYDIYNQKIRSVCQTCKEELCICYEAGVVDSEQKEFENKIVTLFE